MDPAALCTTEKARREELLNHINAATFFYVALPPHGSTQSIVLGRRTQQHSQKSGKRFTDITHTVGPTNILVKTYLDRIKDVDAAYSGDSNLNPSSEETMSKSISTSLATPQFLLHANPDITKQFRKDLAIWGLKITKRKPDESQRFAGRRTPKPLPVTVRSRASEPREPIRPQAAVSSNKENTPTASRPSKRPPHNEAPLIPVEVSAAISLSTSRVVTMTDIITLLCPSYLLPTTIPWTTDVTKLLDHAEKLKAIRKQLRQKFQSIEALDAEIETMRNIQQIFNTKTIPHLPSSVQEAFKNVESIFRKEEAVLSTKQTKVRVLQKVILALNSGRVGEGSSVLAPIEHNVQDRTLKKSSVV